MKNKPIIRKASVKDWDAYLKLKKEEEIYFNKLLNRIFKVSLKDYKKEFNQKVFSKKDILLIAEEKNKVVGYLHGRFFENAYKKWGIIEELFISRSYRRRGIAKNLIEEFSDITKNKNFDAIRLSVDVENKNAIKSYKKLGFELYNLDFKKEIK